MNRREDETQLGFYKFVNWYLSMTFIPVDDPLQHVVWPFPIWIVFLGVKPTAYKRLKI